MDSTSKQNLDLVRAFVADVEAFAQGDALARYLHPEFEQEELPNLLFPKGVRRDAAALLESAAKGRGAMREQRFVVTHEVAAGNMVALEMDWSGTLAVPYGELPPGHVLRARLAMFVEVEGGRIRRQRNYDCYAPIR
ncbi:MAG: nuclear transport factor 2 family protein [Polyangiaceae bacterium]